MGIKKEKNQPTESAELRHRAEEHLSATESESRSPRTEGESKRLLHELEVHQVELEMQNAELRHSRDEAEAAFEKYSDLYDFAPVGYFTLDRDGVIIDSNLTGASLLGIERALLISRRFGPFVSAEARPVFSAFLGKVFASRDKEACEVALKREGKRTLHLLIEAVAVNSGEECRLAVIDITARREAEEELRKSERQLAEAQGIAHIGSWEWDSISDEITGSDEFNQIFGQALSSYDSFLELVHPDDREAVNRAVEETLAHQDPYNVYYRIIRPDQITRIIHARGMAVTDGAGKTVRMVGTAQDVTERREMEDKLEILNSELEARAGELEAANRDLGAFNAAVSHDLKTPLSNINGICQVLLNLYAGRIDEAGQDLLQDIHSSTLRMSDLINTFLKFSRMSHCVIVRQTVGLSGIVKKIADELTTADPARRVTFKISEGVDADGDPALLRVVLENLLGNAWKYSSKKEEAGIEFGMADFKGTPAYFVRDNGAGFDMSKAGGLFTPFHRLDGQDGFSGHGIGLSTVERIIRRHGGQVWAESEQGNGATFYFTLKAD